MKAYVKKYIWIVTIWLLSILEEYMHWLKTGKTFTITTIYMLFILVIPLFYMKDDKDKK